MLGDPDPERSQSIINHIFRGKGKYAGNEAILQLPPQRKNTQASISLRIRKHGTRRALLATMSEERH